MKIEVGEVWSWTDENGKTMKRLILRHDERTWTSKILICEYNTSLNGKVDTFEYGEALMDEEWILDEAEMVRNIIKSYE